MNDYINVFKRTEIKYLLSGTQYTELLPFLEKYFKVDQYGKTRINNIYFDTPNFYMIRTSLEKPVYKEKLRLRTYGDTDDNTNSFIEIKKKYNGVVYKRRISGSYIDSYNYLIKGMKPLNDSQISREIENLRKTYKDLKPSMIICYDRIAMAGKSNSEQRITFDTNISWSTKPLDLRHITEGTPILKSGEVMMEIKVLNAMPMNLARKLSELGIFPTSFSKYGKGYMDMIRKSSGTYINTYQPEELFEKGVVIYA